MEQMADGSVEVHSSYQVPSGMSPLQLNYTIYQNGEIVVNYQFTPKREMVRAGITFDMPARYKQVRYFGLGPHETMIDRKTSGAVGVYQTTVDEIKYDYPHPQENGNRSDIRWASLQDKNEKGLLITAKGESLLNFSAWPYTQEDLAKAEHLHELPDRDQTSVNIGYAQKGAGDLFSYLQGYPEGAILAPRQEYSFSFILKAIS
jgi:beta-galactosidase